MRNIYLKFAEMEGDISGIVIATIISTSGSTPLKAGSSALFDRDGLVYGTVGGGILEGRVTSLAREYSGTGRSGIHNFELDNDISRKDEAICGGRASLLIDASPGEHHKTFLELKKMLLLRQTVVMATRIVKDKRGNNTIKRDLYMEGDSGIPAAGTEGLVLLETITPRKQLIIAGAGHIGKVLCYLGNLLDFEVTVIDDRPEFANPFNLPDAENIVVGDIGTEMDRIELNRDTYIVIVTRGHNDDSNALKACIRSHTSYTGMIGSKTKIEKMKRNFLANGWATDEEWASLHAPVGIDIGSQTVEEIAVSISAELIMARNSRN